MINELIKIEVVSALPSQFGLSEEFEKWKNDVPY